MFKKDPGLKPLSNLKSSERRRMLTSICQTYDIPQEKITPETEQGLVPTVVSQATFKSPLGYNGTIFTDGEQTPIWFKTKDSNLIPTVFTLWKCPFILPRIHTQPHVIDILANGANLMLPGTLPPFDKRCTEGALVGISDSAHPSVVKAVGYCKLNMTQFDYVIGRTGVAVEIIHVLEDELFKMCDVEFTMPEEISLDIPLKEEEPEPIAIEETIDDDNGEAQVEGEPQEKMESYMEQVNDVVTQTETPSEQIEDEVDEISEAVVQLSVEDADHLFKRGLLQSLFLDTIDTPITASNFMANHVLKNLPAVDSSLLSVKKTSWKKSAKFLKAMEKAGYLKVKGKGDDLTITSVVGRENEEIKTFVPHKVKKNGSASDKPVSNKKDKTKELVIVNLYKPTGKSRLFFSKLDATFNQLYTTVELRELLNKYISLQNLVSPKNPKNILLDDNLLSITGEKNSSIGRDKVLALFMTNFTPNYKILKPGDNLNSDKVPIYKGNPPKVQIVSEMRLGRKIITRISCFEHFYIKPQVLADELKVKCSGSSTIGTCANNPKLTEVTIQGPHGKLVIELLTEKGVPITFIAFEDKVKPKKRRTIPTPAA